MSHVQARSPAADSSAPARHNPGAAAATWRAERRQPWQRADNRPRAGQASGRRFPRRVGTRHYLAVVEPIVGNARRPLASAKTEQRFLSLAAPLTDGAFTTTNVSMLVPRVLL